MYAPFLPHITEEIYHRIFSRYEKGISIHLEKWPDSYEKRYLEEGRIVKDIIASVRRYKIERGLSSLNSVIIITPMAKSIQMSGETIKGALSIREIGIYEKGDVKEIIVEARPVLQKLGPLLRDSLNKFLDKIRSTPPEKLLNGIEFNEIYIGPENFEFRKTYMFEGSEVDLINSNNFSIIIKK
jgi:valyl-tRNA synthetase